jgi:AAA family ATP:ADP antiporter
MTSNRPAHAVRASWIAKCFKSLAIIEPHELPVVLLCTLCFFLLFGSYSIVKPVRDAMGTVYGMSHIQELFTGTFVASLVFAPLYSALAARIRLSRFLPGVYVFIAASLLAFCAQFIAVGEHEDRWIAAGFYVWVSTFNILIISVFWSFMADLFSAVQAKRLFGFIAAGATLGGIAGPALATGLAHKLGNNGLMIVSAAGFLATAAVVVLLARVPRLLRGNEAATRGELGHKLPGSPFAGFKLLFQSRYLLMITAFLLLMTWISTIVYIQLGDLITHAFPSREARTQAYATIDLVVNSLAVFVQLLGTGRLIQRFGVTFGLLVNPVIMVFAFIAVAFSPVLLVLSAIQVARRVAEYAVAKPTREMLFTAVDQDAKYKAKNVIDTVVYRFGDVSSAWVSAWIQPFGVAGLAVFGMIVALLWFPVAWALGRQYEHERGEGTAAARESGRLRPRPRSSLNRLG